MSDFYVGYQPKAPDGLKRFVKTVAIGLLTLSAGIAALLVFAQSPFAASHFEFQQYRDYEGTIEDWPYPMLATKDARYLLVNPGKHGAVAQGLAGKSVRLKGELIQRSENRMLELLPGSINVAGDGPAAPAIVDLGLVKLTGEIVDSKCFLGVMNPGEGKVHRDCAVRCISGGVPPAFLVRDASGEARVVLLTGSDGRRIGAELLDYVAEPVTISGTLVRVGPNVVLKMEPKDLRRE
jgi:hypothetical protein